MSQKTLTPFRMAGYAVGHFGINLSYTGLSLYLLYYYTDILKISPTQAGLIFMLPLIWDGITDPLMGLIASRTRSRMGSFRPYILLGTPFLAISFVMMFAAPLLFPGAVLAASAISHIVFRTLFTVVSIPYNALMAVMSQDSAERGRLSGFKTTAAISGALFTAAVTLNLAQYLGDGDLKVGFLRVSVLYAIATTIIMTFVFFVTFEKDPVSGPRKQLTLRQSVRFLTRNKAYWLMFIGVLCGAAGSSIGTKAVVYYVTYNAGRPDAITAVLTSGLVTASLSAPFWALAYKYLKKRTVWLLGAGGYFVVSGIMLIVAPTEVPTIMVIRAFDGFCLSAIVVTYWAMLPDTVEYGEWRSGVRDEGAVFGINQFALKAATGLGVGILGLGLGAVSYVPNAPQSSEALRGILFLSFAGPMIGYGLSMISIFFYPIDRVLHRRLLRAIAYRNTRAEAREQADDAVQSV